MKEAIKIIFIMMTWMTINGVCYNLAFSVISSRVSLSMRDSDKVLKQI